VACPGDVQTGLRAAERPRADMPPAPVCQKAAVLRISADGCPSELCGVRTPGGSRPPCPATVQDEGLWIGGAGDPDGWATTTSYTAATARKWVLRTVYEPSAQRSVPGGHPAPSPRYNGADCTGAPSEVVDRFSLRTLAQSPPVPAILFLSGGLAEERGQCVPLRHQCGPPAAPPWQPGVLLTGRPCSIHAISQWKGQRSGGGSGRPWLARAKGPTAPLPAAFMCRARNPQMNAVSPVVAKLQLLRRTCR